MEALGEAVRSAAEDLWLERMHASQTRSDYPPYKALGMAYIAFAGEEPQLFRLLFMCDRSPEIQAKDGLQEWLPVVHDATGLEETDATMFHLEIWAFVHGIAVMHATHYLDLPEALVSRILTDTFLGLKHQWGDANVRDRNQSTDEKV